MSKPSEKFNNSELKDCPDSPNCVNSYSSDATHGITAIKYQGEAVNAINTMAQIIESQSRSSIVAHENNYLRAEFTSLIFRFVDDVEFLVDTKNNVLQLRSASRLGHKDFGVNRKRIEKLRQLFAAKYD